MLKVEVTQVGRHSATQNSRVTPAIQKAVLTKYLDIFPKLRVFEMLK